MARHTEGKAVANGSNTRELERKTKSPCSYCGDLQGEPHKTWILSDDTVMCGTCADFRVKCRDCGTPFVGMLSDHHSGAYVCGRCAGDPTKPAVHVCAVDQRRDLAKRAPQVADDCDGAAFGGAGALLKSTVDVLV